MREEFYNLWYVKTLIKLDINMYAYKYKYICTYI